jgi:hypothetical protein
LAQVKKMPVHTKDLVINGQAAAEILPPDFVGVFLRKALRKVQKGEWANSRGELLSRAKNWMREI